MDTALGPPRKPWVLGDIVYHHGYHCPPHRQHHYQRTVPILVTWCTLYLTPRPPPGPEEGDSHLPYPLSHWAVHAAAALKMCRCQGATLPFSTGKMGKSRQPGGLPVFTQGPKARKPRLARHGPAGSGTAGFGTDASRLSNGSYPLASLDPCYLKIITNGR